MGAWLLISTILFTRRTSCSVQSGKRKVQQILAIRKLRNQVKIMVQCLMVVIKGDFFEIKGLSLSFNMLGAHKFAALQ